MNRWLVPFGSLAAIVLGIVVALAVAGVFDGGDASGDRAQGEGDEESDTAALCVEGGEDCEDMIEPGDGTDGDDVAGTCLEGEPDCNDTPGDGVSQLCAEGEPDCDDLPCAEGDDCDEPVSNDNVDEPVSYDSNEQLAIEAAFAALEEMGGSSAPVEVSGIKPVDWPDSCLGVAQEGVVCAQVITPGYQIVLSGDSDWEFHTDLNGNAVFFPHD